MYLRAIFRICNTGKEPNFKKLNLISALAKIAFKNKFKLLRDSGIWTHGALKALLFSRQVP
jgi:hypothetical protein